MEDPAPPHPDQTQAVPAARQTAHRRFLIAIAALVVLFALSIACRNRIRSEWWAWRLTRSQVPSEHAYYMNALVAVGQDALPVTQRLARNERAELRTYAVAVLGRFRHPTAYETLQNLVFDADRDVREAAALTLVFFSPAEVAADLLQAPADTPDAGSASAAFLGLGRLATPPAIKLLCEGVRDHPAPAARAQAVESLAEALMPSTPDGIEPAPLPDSPCDPVAALVAALGDSATFTGTLSGERETEAVSRFIAASTTMPVDSSIAHASGRRTVADIATQSLTRLCGRPIDAHSALENPAETASTCRTWILERRSRG
jgi:hypothetical protein